MANDNGQKPEGNYDSDGEKTQNSVKKIIS